MKKYIQEEKQIERKIILNAFRPNAEIDNPSRFAGRQELVKELTDALLTENSCPIIYGDKGLGKTSLAAQLARIALGDKELLIEIGAKKFILSKEDTFVPFFIKCSDAIKTKKDILQRIINNAEGSINIEDLNNSVLTKTTKTKKIKLKIFEAETAKIYNREQPRGFSKLDIEDKFMAVINTLSIHNINKILFIIDELDRVANTKGFSNFIKNVSSANIKFLLVGISQSISTLLADHESIERNLVPIKVSRMEKEELQEIIEKTIRILQKNDVNISFSDEAIALLVQSSGGFPWFIHVLGSEALKNTWDAGRIVINEADIKIAILKLSQNRFAQQFSDIYQQAVRDSVQREIVLRLMAKWDDNDIPLSEIYRVARQLDVTNPSTAKKDLLRIKNGASLIIPPSHERGIVRFKNAMFKRYINLRNSIYKDIKTRVDSITW
jgi:histone H3/H4